MKENEVYHIGIIDYLQKWDFNKKMERFAKTTFLNKKGTDLSAIEPREYQERFVNQMAKILVNPIDDLHRQIFLQFINEDTPGNQLILWYYCLNIQNQ